MFRLEMVMLRIENSGYIMDYYMKYDNEEKKVYQLHKDKDAK